MKKLIPAFFLTLLLSACVDYTPTPKTYLHVREQVIVIPEGHTDGVNQLFYALQALPSEDIIAVEAVANRVGKRFDDIDYTLRNIPKLKRHYSYAPSEAPEAVTVTVRYQELGLPTPCPDWRHSGITNYDNSTLSNHGCANMTNAYLMVDDKEDLKRGKSDHLTDSQNAVRGLEDYYSGRLSTPVESEERTVTSDR